MCSFQQQQISRTGKHILLKRSVKRSLLSCSITTFLSRTAIISRRGGGIEANLENMICSVVVFFSPLSSSSADSLSGSQLLLQRYLLFDLLSRYFYPLLSSVLIFVFFASSYHLYWFLLLFFLWSSFFFSSVMCRSYPSLFHLLHRVCYFLKLLFCCFFY